jgi:hypothetical protein
MKGKKEIGHIEKALKNNSIYGLSEGNIIKIHPPKSSYKLYYACTLYERQENEL